MFNSVTKLSHVSFVRETGELRVTVHVFEACLRHNLTSSVGFSRMRQITVQESVLIDIHV